MALGMVERLKDSYFTSESRIGELNQNQNSKQSDWPDAVWKLYYILKINQ